MASRKTIYFGLAVLWFGVSMVQAAKTNSLILRAEENARQQKIRGMSITNDVRMGPSVPRTTKPRSGYLTPLYQFGPRQNVLSNTGSSVLALEQPSPKVIQVHDLVSIIVHESSKHTTKEDTKAEREYTIDAALKDWLRLSGTNLRPDKQTRGDPKVSFSFEREFEGKGDVKRQDTLTARIQAEVIDVLPNGNLVLEATHTVVTNEEETHITLTGICRSKDVGIDNKVLSDNLAQLVIRKMHKGIARDANKRGLLSGLIDLLAIF
jgi:flagellar L-ring protein FlgH